MKPTALTCFLLLLFVLAGSAPVALGAAKQVTGLSTEGALRLGEAMYLKGVLPSGKPMKALVQGDIVVTGKMITCANCHMRSGLGSFEGTVLTLPTNGAKLFSPLLSGQDLPGTGMTRGQLKYPRPAYTDESLARVLTSGIDSAGKMLSLTMPRYILDEAETEIMVFYLRHLSSEHSPGVSGETMRFATIVTEGVRPEDRRAMLDPLASFVRDEWNANLPVLAQLQRDKAYRTLSLDVWELKGLPDTWKGQLEDLYRQRPVFGLLGGLSSGTWKPVHEFCESNRVPCVFPITETPEISGTDWYTLYFSKGYYQEGEAAAKYLARVFDLPPDREILQVLRENGQGKALSQGFTETWKRLGKAAMKTRTLSPGDKAGREFWKELSASYRNAVMLLWLAPGDLDGMETLAEIAERPSMVFVSSTMLDGKLSSLPDSVRDFIFITYPNRLPDQSAYVSSIVDQWLRAKKLSTANLTVSSKVYFLTRMLARVLTDMRGNLYRDYFLDLFDVLEDQTGISATYPRLSFGPGQRYASKGCYIVTLTKGPQPKIIRQSDWIIY